MAGCAVTECTAQGLKTEQRVANSTSPWRRYHANEHPNQPLTHFAKTTAACESRDTRDARL